MSQNDEVIYITVGKLERRYVVHRPAGSQPMPLILMLDGRGGTPWTAMKTTGWSEKADHEKFIVVYPEALRLNPKGPQHFLENPQMWTTGSSIYGKHTIEVDDLGFLRAVITDVKSRFPIDASRVYMTGFSNGAAMTFRFALEAPELLTAIAPVSGYFYVKHAVAKRLIPTIYFFGTDDPLNPFDGGTVHLPWGVTDQRPPIRECLARWLQVNGMEPNPTNTIETENTREERYGDDMVFHIVKGLGHVWPGGRRILPERIVGKTSDRVNATDLIWDFFRLRATRA